MNEVNDAQGETKPNEFINLLEDFDISELIISLVLPKQKAYKQGFINVYAAER